MFGALFPPHSRPFPIKRQPKIFIQGFRPVPNPDQPEQKLRELAGRELKTREKWVSFKKKLRANKGIDPDLADQKYRDEEAKFDAEMRLIDERRAKLMAKAVHI